MVPDKDRDRDFTYHGISLEILYIYGNIMIYIYIYGSIMIYIIYIYIMKYLWKYMYIWKYNVFFGGDLDTVDRNA